MEIDHLSILKLVSEIIIFLLLIVIFRFGGSKLKKSSNRFLNPKEYLPEEEIHSLRQIFYLMMMALIFIDILYAVVFIKNDIIYFVLFDILLSLYIASSLDTSSLKNKILIILLVPYGSLTYLIFGNSLVGLIDLIQIPVLIYFIKVYFDKFREYTQSNGLGIAVILLFAIIFISFLATQVSENVNPLDSLVMVSNAFTSNGYAVLGKSIPGKINAIILVWGGYLLSGVGTATLTAAILTKHFNNRFDELEKKIEKNNDD
ncbi:hypothetical protein [Methanobrevibacter sp.]|uniref:hypothetical protein n=1 Tax=Methanobrevibacter sp. TaxID=66852 RepID=UPI003890F288